MHLCAITHRRLQKGNQGAQGKDLPQPVDLKEAADDIKVDHGAGDGGSATSRGYMH